MIILSPLSRIFFIWDFLVFGDFLDVGLFRLEFLLFSLFIKSDIGAKEIFLRFDVHIENVNLSEVFRIHYRIIIVDQIFFLLFLRFEMIHIFSALISEEI